MCIQVAEALGRKAMFETDGGLNCNTNPALITEGVVGWIITLQWNIEVLPCGCVCFTRIGEQLHGALGKCELLWRAPILRY